MRTKFYFVAALAATLLASCADDKFVGDNSPNASQENAGVGIQFGLNVPGRTRADIGGYEAAKLLGSHFYVTGTKDTEGESNPTPTLVFDNYLVRYGVNTAGNTESNTANWEYVGVEPGTNPDNDYAKLGSYSGQTIKYWDFNVLRYDFFGFSTGSHKAIIYDATHTTFPVAGQIGVTAMKYGTDLSGSQTAYTFTLPNVAALEQAYITDIVKAEKGASITASDYGKDVTLRFKNLGAKVRIALYETIPGYSVKNVVFYTVDGTTDFTDASKSATAKLISSDANGIPTNGSIAVYFPHVGSNNSSEQDYDKAAATVTSPTTGATATYETYRDFGALTNQLVAKESAEAGDNNVFIGRNLPTASFAGDANKKFYQTVFPVSTSSPLTLRVDYTLVPIDGAAETITVYGAKATVPSKFTVWQPNYAYTYIFKISDNTNGWTSPDHMQDGLFPITFDAVVAERTDATAEQKTITTVATPSITTYQQNHDNTKIEYSKATGKDIFVQVMDNSTTSPSLKGDLKDNTPDSKPKSLLYAVDAEHASTATEAMVMDALEKRKTLLTADDVTGRNGITLTKSDKIDNTVTKIENGPDDNPISVNAGQAAKITIAGDGSLGAGTYAYVYDYSTAAKTTVTWYQPITTTKDEAIGTSGVKYASITTETLNGISTKTENNEAVSNDYIYFSKTKDGESTYKYSYISVTGKTKLPADLIKVLKTSLTSNVDGATSAVEGTFYFDIYTSNSGSYAVKVIKVVSGS